MYLSAANTIKLATNSNGRLTIDSSGNMGLAITPDTQGTTVDSLQIGSVTNLYNESSDDYTILGNNIYFDGTNNKYIKTQESSRLMQNAGQFWFQQAGSGSADANITYTTPLFIKTGGNLGIGTTNPSFKLQIQGTDNAGSGLYLYNSTGAEGIKIVPESNGNCRIYSSTADALALGTDSTDRITMAADGSNIIFSGTDFGFGTTPGGTPAAKNVFIAIGDSDTGIVQDGDGQLELWANATEVANINAIDGYTSTKRVYTTGTGRFGSTRINSVAENADSAFDDLVIGDYSGNRGISILSGATAQGAVGFAKSGTTADGYLAYVHHGTATSSAMTLKSQGHIKFNAGSSTKFYIEHDGKVGIGTTSPGQKLGVAGNIRFESADPTLEFNNGGGMVYARVANTLQFATGGGPSSPQEKMRIDSSGRLLIADAGTATNTPMETFGSAILQIATSGGASIVLGRNDSSVAVDNGIGNIYFDGNAASGGAWNDVARISCAADGTHADGDYPSRLTFHTTADSAATVSERLRIDSNGYVGIKLTNPHLYYAKDLVVQAISQGGITVKSSSTTDTNYLMFADGTSGNERYRGYIGYAHNTGSDNGEHLQFAASGGTGLMRFYADGIALGGETAAANRLNDYETGTWTPTFSGYGGDAGSFTYAGSTNGKYTKIGNQVTIWWYCAITNMATLPGGTYLTINSLPFTAAGGAPVGEGASAVINWWNPQGTGLPSGDNIVGFVQNNTTRIVFGQQSASNIGGFSPTAFFGSTTGANSSYMYGMTTYIG
jgi:hypothetical protein